MKNMLSERALEIPGSQTLGVIDKVAELKSRGMTITSFSTRVPTPQPIIDAAVTALGEPWSAAYTMGRGIPELRRAIATKVKAFNNIDADAETEILVTVGAKEAIFLTMMALVNPGDEVLLPDPEWVSYEPCINMAGGKVVRFPLVERNGFQPDVDDLRKRITKRTKLIILNTPHNPTGAVFSRAVLEAIGHLAHEHDLTVLSDEVYEHHVYGEHKHVSIASLPGMRERTITLSATSKILNMFGWRVGWAIGDRKLIDRMANIHQHVCACATSFAQAGTVAALQLSLEVIQQRVAIYAGAREELLTLLNDIDGVTCHNPEGGYCAFPNVSGFGKSSDEVSRMLLENHGVQSVPGSAFGPNGEGHIRMVFACGRDDVLKGADQLRAAFAALK